MIATFSPPVSLTWQEFIATIGERVCDASSMFSFGTNSVTIQTKWDQISIEPNTTIRISYTHENDSYKERIESVSEDSPFTLTTELDLQTYSQLIKTWISCYNVPFSGKLCCEDETDGRWVLKSWIDREEELVYNHPLLRTKSDHTSCYYVQFEPNGEFHLFSQWGTYSGPEKETASHRKIVSLFAEVYEKQKLRNLLN